MSLSDDDVIYITKYCLSSHTLNVSSLVANITGLIGSEAGVVIITFPLGEVTTSTIITTIYDNMIAATSSENIAVIIHSYYIKCRY